MNFLFASKPHTFSIALAILLFTSNTLADSFATPCPADLTAPWTECSGTLVKEGNKYTGEFLNNLFHGKGVYWFSGGDYYNGAFKNGLPHGWGVFFFMSDDKLKGDKYIGDFQYGQAQGRGTTFFHTGAVYSGHYNVGLPDGSGIYIDRDGAILHEGIWRSGKFVESARLNFQSASDIFIQTEQQMYLKNTEIENLNHINKEQQQVMAELQANLEQLQQFVQTLEQKHTQQLQSMATVYLEKIRELETALSAQKNAELQLRTEIDQLKQISSGYAPSESAVNNTVASPQLITVIEPVSPTAESNRQLDDLPGKSSSKPLWNKKKAEPKAVVRPAPPTVDPMKDTFLYLQ